MRLMIIKGQKYKLHYSKVRGETIYGGRHSA